MWINIKGMYKFMYIINVALIFQFFNTNFKLSLLLGLGRPYLFWRELMLGSPNLPQTQKLAKIKYFLKLLVDSKRWLVIFPNKCILASLKFKIVKFFSGYMLNFIYTFSTDKNLNKKKIKMVAHVEAPSFARN